MFSYDKFLQFPICIKRPNPKLANIIITQYGGPHGELGASLRYLSQRYVMPDDVSKGLLTDIGVSTTILPPNTNKVNDSTNSMSFTLFKGILNHF